MYKPKAAEKAAHEKNAQKNDKMDLQSLTEDQVNQLLSQNITLDQIAQIALDEGQPIPPIVKTMMEQQTQVIQQPQQLQGPTTEEMPPPSARKKMQSKSSKYPTMMDVKTYNEYKNVVKEEEGRDKTQEHAPNIYGYTFSPLISAQLMEDMKRTQGSFFVGVNLSNLLNTFRDMVVDSETQPSKQKKTDLIKSNPESIFNKIGEWVDVDFEKILDKKMGFRGSDIPLIPEKKLTDYSTFYEILTESKKYSDRGFNGKITPFALLIMTRMLYKYRNSNSQWFRVATVLELIFKYLGSTMTRDQYFKNNDEISLMGLMELEEFYNTDHIFMSKNELIKFKEDLDFYKYDRFMNVKKEIIKLKSKKPPPI
jgi:hypothetical protein